MGTGKAKWMLVEILKGIERIGARDRTIPVDSNSLIRVCDLSEGF